MKHGLVAVVLSLGVGLSAPAAAQTVSREHSSATAPGTATQGPAEETLDDTVTTPPDARTANNAVYLEVLGASLFYSLNYDRRIGDLSLRAGLMYVAVSSDDPDNGDEVSVSAAWAGVPLSVTYNIGSLAHALEIGAGATLHVFGGSVNALGVESSGAHSAVLGHAILGYRYQPREAGFFLRAGLTPVFGKGVFLPWPHVGLGGTF